MTYDLILSGDFVTSLDEITKNQETIIKKIRNTKYKLQSAGSGQISASITPLSFLRRQESITNCWIPFFNGMEIGDFITNFRVIGRPDKQVEPNN